MTMPPQEVAGLSPGPETPLIVWLGDRPGYDDNRANRLWSGPGGKLLRDHYVKPLADRASHVMTVALPAYFDAKPPDRTYREARPDLTARLRELGSVSENRVLVALGAEACSYVHSLDKSFPSAVKKALSHQLRTIEIGDQTWTVLFTYHPGHLFEDPNLARAADNHHRLLRLYLDGRMARRSRPNFVRPTLPIPADPKTITLDIETYGAVERFGSGIPAPTQKDTDHNGRFHPARSVYEDRPERLVVTVAVTVPEFDPADPRPLLLWDGTFPHSRQTLLALKPGRTMTFNMERPEHRSMLASWIRHSETIIGHNLLFDLQNLRFSEPLARATLPLFSKHLIDTVILAYLQDETRPERALKDLGPLLGLFLYEETLKHRRFRNPTDRGLHRYNGEDTHNTTILAASLAAMIDDEWASTDKAEHECLAFYSRTMWSVLDMLERGVAFSTPQLLKLEEETRATIEEATAFCLEAGVKIFGPGSKKSSVAFIESLCDRIPDIKNHPLFVLTEKTKAISCSALNLKLCKYHLPPDDEAHAVIDNWILALSRSKLLNSYLMPLLYATNNTLKYAEKEPHKLNRSSTLIPEVPPCSFASWLRLSPSPVLAAKSGSATPPSPTVTPPATDISIAYPRVYITPSSTTDSAGDEGGTEQMRLVFKGPALQTIPPEIQGCQTARRTGWGPFAMDLAQIEMRVPGLLSGEQKLIDAFVLGHDLHTNKAISIFGESFLRERLGLAPDRPIDKNVPGFDEYRQVGKAQPLSEVIQTPDGPRPLRDLKVGDEVFGSNGQPTKITHIYPQGVKPVYTLTFGDGSSTRACAEHLWAARQAQNTLTKIYSTQDFIDNPSRRFEIPLAAPVDYGWGIDLEIPPYVLGAFLGDGSIVAGTPQIANHLNDQEIVDKISSLLEGWNLRIFRPDPDEVSVSFATEIKGRTYINPLKHAFQAIGVWGQGAYQKHIPEQYLRASYQDRLELLRGLMDTDGTISEGNSASFSTVSDELAAQVQQLIFSLGGTCRLKRKKGTYKGRVYSSWSVDAIRTPECPFSLARKAARWQPLRLFRRLLSVKPAGSEECACIRVEADDHLYLTKDFIVTHNTDNFASQFWATAKTMQKTVFEDQMIYVPIEFFDKAVKSRPTSMETFYKWQLDTVREGHEAGYLHLPLLGLSRHFVGGAEYHLNKLLNFKVQALAAAVLIDIQHRLVAMQSPHFFLTYQVYDAVKGEYNRRNPNALQDAIAVAVDQCSTRGVWGQYQSLYNRKVPLDYSLELK